jgi:ferredoxin--NADP+ reductase
LFFKGENPKKPGTPNNVRLYSIASTRYGDLFDGKTATLCVRRAVYYDPETGKEDPSKKGICSNFLCDAKPGDKVQIAGTCTLIPVHFVTCFVWVY